MENIVLRLSCTF